MIKPSHEKSSIDLSEVTNEDLSQGSVMMCTSLSITKEYTFKESEKTKGHSPNGCISLKTILTPWPILHV